MPTRNVVLTDHQANLLEHMMSSSCYQNASEVLREGLRLVERLVTEDDLRLAALREAARVGTTDIDTGAFSSFNLVDALGRHKAALTAEVTGA